MAAFRLGVAVALVDGRMVEGDIEVEGGRVTAVGLAGGGAGTAAPGFIDLQLNGFAGIDLLSARAEDYLELDRALLATGVTAFQPSLITAPEQSSVAALGQMAAAQLIRRVGPKLLGAHLEGPFLAPERLGAHSPEWRREPDLALLRRLLDAGPVTCVTLAPERPGALEMIDLLVGRGVAVACGHSNATAVEAQAAFDRGARTVTHLFNGMRPLEAREPGLAGVALSRQDVVVQLIVDGRHVAPEMVALAWRAAAGRVALVTDAVSAAGAGEGVHHLGGVAVRVEKGAARRQDDTLAGSLLTMPEAVRNLHDLGIPLIDCLQAASTVPARVLGRRDVGRLTVGGAADVVVLDDQLEVRRVLVDGREP